LIFKIFRGKAIKIHQNNQIANAQFYNKKESNIFEMANMRNFGVLIQIFKKKQIYLLT